MTVAGTGLLVGLTGVAIEYIGIGWIEKINNYWIPLWCKPVMVLGGGLQSNTPALQGFSEITLSTT